MGEPTGPAVMALGALPSLAAAGSRLVAEGLTNAEIGEKIFITAGTAKTHIANVQAKLKVRNRVGIAAWSWENGLAGPAPRE